MARGAGGVAAGTVLVAMLIAWPTAALAAPSPIAVAPSTANAVGAEGGNGGSVDAAASTPGTGLIRVGGSTLASRIVTDGLSVVLSADGNPQLIVMAQKDGARQRLTPDGVLVVGRGGDLWVTVTGLAPESAVSMWSMSRPTELGSTLSDHLGFGGTLLTLPSDIEPGAHTLVVNGVDVSGDPLTLQLGFELREAAPVSAALYAPTTEAWTVPLPLLAVLGLVLMLVVLIVARLRRDREPA
jgi:hypothetical protein